MERGTRVKASQISDIRPADITAYATNTAVDGYVPAYDEVTGKWTWTDITAAHDRQHSIVDLDDHSDKVDYIDIPYSPTLLTGGILSSGTSVGTLKVSALTALIRIDVLSTDALKKITLGEQDNQTIVSANTVYYVVLDYNADSPQIVIQESEPNNNNQIQIGRCLKGPDNIIHYRDSGFRFSHGIQKTNERIRQIREWEFSKSIIIADEGSKQFSISAGFFFRGITALDFSAFDSSQSGNIFTYVYYNFDTSSWVYVSDQTNIDVDNYNLISSGTGLAACTKYKCDWVFVHPDDGHVFIVYGQDNDNFGKISDSNVPTLPDLIDVFGALIGRIIVDGGVTTFERIEMITTTSFNPQVVIKHNDNSIIQGGDGSDEYYHLNLSDYTELTEWLDNVTLGSSGETTFTVFPITPSSAPTADYQVANKKFVDDSLAGISADKIIEGNSSVEVVDTGTGYVKIEIDGTETARFGDGTTEELLELINAGTNHGLYLQQNADLATDKYAFSVITNTAQSGSGWLMLFKQEHGSSTKGLLQLENRSSGTCLRLFQKATLASSGQNVLTVYSDAVQTTGTLVRITQANASSTRECLTIENTGSGTSLYFNQTGVLDYGKNALQIRSSAAQTIPTAFLVNFGQLNASSTQTALKIYQEGTGHGIDVEGTILLNNKLIFTQTDKNEYIDSLNDGYLDIEATTGIRFRINTTEQLNLVDGELAPTTDDDIDLGDATHKFKNLYLDGILYTDSISMLNVITEFSTDGTLVDNSDSAIPTEKAVKTYVDSRGIPIFEEVDSVVRQDDDTAGYDEDFVFGSPQLTDDNNADHDRRMFFDKSKAAFRVGRVIGSQWDEDNLGDYSFATGYNNIASGNYSTALGGTNITSASNSVAMGSNNNVSADSGVAMGGSNTVNASYAVAMGTSNTASGSASVVMGGNNIAGNFYTVAMGSYSNAYLRSQFATAYGKFSSVGDAQYSRIVLRADTTDATSEVMYINNNSNLKLVLPAGTAWRFDGVVIATTPNCALSSSWTIKGVIHRDDANNTELIWSSVTEDVDEIVTDAVITLTADDTNEALEINITGKTATNIRWVATVHLTEVGY